MGGAEFRLPVLAGIFRLNTLEAVIFNKARLLAYALTLALLGKRREGDLTSQAGQLNCLELIQTSYMNTMKK